MLWALAGAVLDLDWRDLPEDLKQQLLDELDELDEQGPTMEYREVSVELEARGGS